MRKESVAAFFSHDPDPSGRILISLILLEAKSSNNPKFRRLGHGGFHHEDPFHPWSRSLASFSKKNVAAAYSVEGTTSRSGMTAKAAAQESPTPKPTSMVKCPGFSFPWLQQSAIAIGILLETVLPRRLMSLK